MERDNCCFGCGTDNPVGLRLRFERDQEGRVVVHTRVPGHFQGYRDTVHGGILSTLLDEVMAEAVLSSVPFHAATARLEVRYRHPVPTESDITVVAEVVTSGSRRLTARGSVLDAAGRVAVEGEALFVRVSTPAPEPRESSPSALFACAEKGGTL